MPNRLHDMDMLFEGVYNKLLAPDFGKKLGGELPLYIQPIPAESQSYVDGQLQRLTNRLKKKGVESLSINLYDLCITILEEENVLETVLEEEPNLPQEDIMATFDSILDIKTVVIPKIQEMIRVHAPTFLFISGVGTVYPFVRSHGILNNMDELTNNCTMLLFFPGEYNNLQLNLFGRISDENYYRGHNLNEIKTI
ncbi:MAG: DUF1788 domain-containing protein [Phocaeicola sp.]